MKLELVLTVLLISGALAQGDQQLCGAGLLAANKPECPPASAPGDADDASCFGGRNAVHHNFFGDNVKVLLDNYAYPSLYGSSGPWESRDGDGDRVRVSG